MSIPTNHSSTSGANITFSDMNAGPTSLVLSSANGVSTTVSANGSGGITLSGSSAGAVYQSHTFSKPDLEEKIKQFQAGKYTRRYVEVYLDFMLMNAMLDNLEYLEYKVQLDRELPQ